jgi:hypothetical protein
MFGFRLLPTNSDLIIIKKLFRAANLSGAGGDEKLKIIFNWPYSMLFLTNQSVPSVGYFGQLKLPILKES